MTNSKNNKNWITWKIIRRAVIYDEVRGPLLLKEYNITIIKVIFHHINYYRKK